MSSATCATLFLLAVAIPAHGLTLAEAMAQALRANASVAQASVAGGVAAAAARAAQSPFDGIVSVAAARGTSIDPLDTAGRALVSNTLSDVTRQTTQSANGQAVYSRLLENGWTPAVEVDTASSTDALSRLQGLPSQRTTTVQLRLAVPLLRNAGLAAVQAREAARLERQAVYADARVKVASVVVSVAQAYWTCVANDERLRLAQQSQERMERLAGDTEKLIRAGEQPAADRHLILASVAERRAETLAATLARSQARRALAILLALPNPDALSREPLEQPFPAQTKVPEPQLGEVMSRRDDVLAARLRVEQAQALLGAARESGKPTLDVVLGMSTNGLREGGGVSWLPSGAALQQPGASVSVNFQMPLERSAARADIDTHALQLQSSRISQEDAERMAYAGVAGAGEQLRNAASTVEQLQDSVARYEAAVSAERTRRNLAQSTLINLLDVEDRYNAAVLALLNARLGWANALAQWQFETASLLSGDASSPAVRVDRLLWPAP